MEDIKSQLEIIYNNCLELVRFRYSKDAHMTTSGLAKDANVATIPEPFGLDYDTFKHTIMISGYVIINYGYLCIMLTNPSRKIGSSLTLFRQTINKAIHPRNAYMKGISEIIFITEKNTSNYHESVKSLFADHPNPPQQLRFIPIEKFAYNYPKNISFVPFIKLSNSDIEKRKAFTRSNAITTGIISRDDVAAVWYGYKSGDVVIARPRSFTTFRAELVFLVQ